MSAWSPLFICNSFLWVHHATSTIVSLFRFPRSDIWLCRDFWFGRVCTCVAGRDWNLRPFQGIKLYLVLGRPMIAFLLLYPTLQTHVEGAHFNLDSSTFSMVIPVRLWLVVWFTAVVTVRGATALGCLVLNVGFVGWILSARSTSSVEGCANLFSAVGC